jgi:hypothetical protein
MTDTELTTQLERYKWYHIIPLTPTVSTPGVKDFAKHHAPVEYPHHYWKGGAHKHWQK